MIFSKTVGLISSCIPRLPRQQPGTRELRDTYVEKCKDFVCEPVKPLIGALNQALSADGELSFIKLNGNSKELFSKRLEYMQVFALAESLHVNNTVVEMDLSYNNIDDAGVTTIARLLKVNRTLKAINLCGNNIGPEGAAKLADALADPGGGGGGLEMLNLRGNPIGEEGGMAMAQMLRTNSTLLDLDVSDCELGMKSMICFASPTGHREPADRVGAGGACMARGAHAGGEQHPACAQDGQVEGEVHGL